MSFNNVCRLCLSKDDLLWVFDGSNESVKMKDIIYLATGIEIRKTDVISRQICNNCYQFTIKMYQFRSQCIGSEKHLKEQYKEHLKRVKFAVPNAEVTPINNELNQTAIQSSDPSYLVHPTITQLSKIYPQIKLPLSCIKSHVAPEVVMDMDEVETYFRKRKLDIKVYVKSALKSLRKTNRLMRLNQLNTNTNTKKNIGTNASIKTHQIINNSVNNNVKVVKNTKAVKNTNIYIGGSGGKQYSKKRSISENKKLITTKLPLETGKQAKFRSKINQKRRLSQILTNLKAKRQLKIKGSLNTMAKNTPDALNQNVFSEPVSGISKTNQLLGVPPINNVLPLNETVPVESLSYIDKSVPLHICNICNSVQYNTKYLRKHQVDHLRCQFCKVHFRTLSKKMYHIEKQCKIKKMMVNVPYVQVKKIEYDQNIRCKYFDAFANFPPLKTENNIEVNNTAEDPLKIKVLKCKTLNDIPNLTRLSNTALTKQTIEDISNVPPDKLDMIEILLDDDELPEMCNETISISSTKNQFLMYNYGLQSNECPITPNVRLRNNCLLNNIDLRDSDLKILKQLLLLSQPITFTQKHTQIDLTRKKEIVIFEGKVILKNLRQHLWIYKIPVTIKYGKLNVSYKDNVSSKKPKKLCLWNDLTPIDVKQTKHQRNSMESDKEFDSFLSPLSFRTSVSINANSKESTVDSTAQPQDGEITLSPEHTKSSSFLDLLSENNSCHNEPYISEALEELFSLQ